MTDDTQDASVIPVLFLPCILLQFIAHASRRIHNFAVDVFSFSCS